MIYYLVLWAASLFLFWEDIGKLLSLSWNDSRYSHLAFIPFISCGVAWFHRKSILRRLERELGMGTPIAAAGLCLWYAAQGSADAVAGPESLALATLGILLTWVGALVAAFGRHAARAALFPLALLVLVVPAPPAIVETLEVALQKASGELTYVIFNATGTPVYRDGLVFALPGLTIEVARECSGIRSFISLFITALVVGHFLLGSIWSKGAYLVLVIPIAIVKNAFRIATLSWLGVYVSPDYLNGRLHHQGGPVFAVVPLAFLLTAAWLLRRFEIGPSSSRNKSGASPSVRRSLDATEPG